MSVERGYLTARYCRVILSGMKIAISIPDPVFQAAERVSKRMQLPRSQFYAKAVAAYVKEQSGDEITRRLNEVYGKAPARLDPVWEAASLDVLRREKW